MVRAKLWAAAAAVGLLMAARHDAAPQPAADAAALDGLWTGAWGGGMRDGVVFQPVIAELVVKGDRVELAGFRTVGRLSGTVRVDAAARRLRITPAAAAGRPAPAAVEFAYELKGDDLTLTDADKVPVSFSRVRVAANPVADARVELVAAAGFTDAGELLVTEYTVLRAGPPDATFHHPETRKRSTKGAAVFVVEDAGLKKVTLDDARRLVKEAAPVVVTYRADDRPPSGSHTLWTDEGPAPPDGAAVGRTLARVLRPGTLVFVLSARENAVVP
jgi:hypothetical protein